MFRMRSGDGVMFNANNRSGDSRGRSATRDEWLGQVYSSPHNLYQNLRETALSTLNLQLQSSMRYRANILRRGSYQASNT